MPRDTARKKTAATILALEQKLVQALMAHRAAEDARTEATANWMKTYVERDRLERLLAAVKGVR